MKIEPTAEPELKRRYAAANIDLKVETWPNKNVDIKPGMEKLYAAAEGLELKIDAWPKEVDILAGMQTLYAAADLELKFFTPRAD